MLKRGTLYTYILSTHINQGPQGAPREHQEAPGSTKKHQGAPRSTKDCTRVLDWLLFAWVGLACLGVTWLGLGLALLGLACLALAWLGLGLAGLCLAWPGFALVGLDWISKNCA